MYVKQAHIKYLRGLLVEEVIHKGEHMDAGEESLIKDLMAYLTIEEYTLNELKSTNGKEGRPRNTLGRYTKKKNDSEFKLSTDDENHYKE